jgi:hypothetical protein
VLAVIFVKYQALVENLVKKTTSFSIIRSTNVYIAIKLYRLWCLDGIHEDILFVYGNVFWLSPIAL